MFLNFSITFLETWMQFCFTTIVASFAGLGSSVASSRVVQYPNKKTESFPSGLFLPSLCSTMPTCYIDIFNKCIYIYPQLLVHSMFLPEKRNLYLFSLTAFSNSSLNTSLNVFYQRLL